MKKVWGLLGCVTVSMLLAMLICVGCSNANSSSSSSDTSSTTARSYTITHIDGTPDWTSIPTLDIDNQPWGDPVDISATAQICYSDDAIYVHLKAREANIRAEYAADDLLGNPYEDSCMEFFFSPVSGDSRYMNIEMNPNCCTCMQIGTSRSDRIRLIPTTDVLQATSDRTDDGWELYYTIPFDYIRLLYPDFNPTSGMKMTGNLYKCGNLTVQKHYLTWNPSTSEKPDFHRPQDFGVLVFE